MPWARPPGRKRPPDRLVSEALRGSHVESLVAVPVPVIGAGFSLAVIVGVLAITAIASLAVDRRRRRSGERGEYQLHLGTQERAADTGSPARLRIVHSGERADERWLDREDRV